MDSGLRPNDIGLGRGNRERNEGAQAAVSLGRRKPMRNKLRYVDVPSLVVIVIAVGAPLVAMLL